MKEQVQVSVIVATYNPITDKLRATLDSIICQTGIVYEIILTDDGSHQKDFSWIPAYFTTHQVRNYRLLEHPKNMGTIRNLLQGVQCAQGKYVYSISPGDLLFDKHVLRDFYQFAEEKECSLCFGNAVYYSAEGAKPKLSQNGRSVPKNPEAYRKSYLLGKMNFFFGDWICGLAYFHKKDNWVGYLEQATQICRYAEDASTTSLALSDGERVWYYDRHIAWYEDGTGISTNGSSKWDEILKQEYKVIMQKLMELHPNDPMVRIANMDHMGISRWNIRIKRMMKYPRIMLIKMLMLPRKKQKILTVTESDLERLQRTLSGETA